MEDFTSLSGFVEPDMTYLDEISSGDTEFAVQIISIFIEEYPAIIDALRSGAIEGDFDQVKFYSHKLVSQLPIIGIVTAVENVKLINKDCAILTDLKERIDSLEKTIEQNILFLKKKYNF